MEIQDADQLFVGGSQLWYADNWHRRSGCGPTAATNIVWYLAHSAILQDLVSANDISTREDYTHLQEGMFSYVTPRAGGVNRSRILTDGLEHYARDHRFNLHTYSLQIPLRKSRRPSEQCLRSFLVRAKEADSPIAFLNLSSGNQAVLDSWHWVTILAYDEQTLEVQFSDQGHILHMDLIAWLTSSALGGALVFVTVSM